MKRVKGYFVLIVKQFDDTMYGADFHYTTWCIGAERFCRYNKTDKLRKFDSFNDAYEFSQDHEAGSSHVRQLEIAYLTTTKWTKDSSDNSNLKIWVQISSEEDAMRHDEKQKLHDANFLKSEMAQPFWWDSTEFYSVYTCR